MSFERLIKLLRSLILFACNEIKVSQALLVPTSVLTVQTSASGNQVFENHRDSFSFFLNSWLL